MPGSDRAAPRRGRPGRLAPARRAAVVAVVVLLSLAAPAPGVQAPFTGSTQATVDVTAATSFYAGAVLADAPVGYWRLSEPSGTTAVAVTGTAGTYQGGGFTRGVAGTTRDGDTALGLPPLLRQVEMSRLVQDDLSIEVWFATTTAVGLSTHWWSAGPLVDADANAAAGDFGVALAYDGTVVAGVGGPDSGDVSIRSAAGYADGFWHHVVFTRSAATGALALWIDGIEVATGTGGTTSLTGSATMTVGTTALDNSHEFTGAIDEVAVYPAVLSGTAIAAHHAAASGTGYAAAVAASSPAGHWRLGETTGTTAAAVAGSAGVYDAASHSVAGATGDGDHAQLFGWEFAGGRPGMYVQLPRDVSGSFSLECWFLATAGTSTALDWFEGAAILGADVAAGGDDFGVTLNADGRVLAGTGTPDTTVYSGTGFADGGWHHVVFTRDGTTGALVLYVDGVQRATATGGTALLTGPPEIHVGRQPDGTNTFAGTVDDVAVYPTVLSAARVALHHQRGAGP